MSAPGYRSYAWTTQDWRVVLAKKGGDVDFSEKCGAGSNRSASGAVRLCLPIYVIRTLRKTPAGAKILHSQALKKARAAPGERVPWHPRIRELHRKLEMRTVPDRKKNPRGAKMAGNNLFKTIKSAASKRAGEMSQVRTILRHLVGAGWKGKPVVHQAVGPGGSSGRGSIRIYMFTDTPAGSFALLTGPGYKPDIKTLAELDKLPALKGIGVVAISATKSKVPQILTAVRAAEAKKVARKAKSEAAAAKRKAAAAKKKKAPAKKAPAKRKTTARKTTRKKTTRKKTAKVAPQYTFSARAPGASPYMPGVSPVMGTLPPPPAPSGGGDAALMSELQSILAAAIAGA